MRIRIGSLEIEVDTMEQLDELVMRYGKATVVVAGSQASQGTAGNEAPSLAAGAEPGGAPAGRADPSRKA
jgi:hypothetical protein